MNSKLSSKVQTQQKRRSTGGFDKKRPPKKKGTFREYAEALGVALGLALLLKIFIIGAYKIPTGSMKDTLLIGDFLLVNKFIYGAKSPDYIPYTDIRLPHFSLPMLTHPKRGDIVVFKYPRDEKLDYIKRCLAVGGQTIAMRAGRVYIDGKPEGREEYMGRGYDTEDHRQVRYYRITTDNGKRYIIRHYADHYAQSENFGPVTVPKKGMTVPLDMNTIDLWRPVIEGEGHDVEYTPDGRIAIDGRITSAYTFRHNYYFMMGDNRDNSADSRQWGFLPEKNLVGKALVIYWSMDREVPFYEIWKKIRLWRIGMLIK